MTTSRTPNALLSSALALIFAGALTLAGCSAGALTGPNAQPAPTAEVVAADAQAPQNHTDKQSSSADEGEDSEDGTETPGAGHNTVDEE